MSALTKEDEVTLSYAKQQKSNALMRDMVELVERLAKVVEAMHNVKKDAVDVAEQKKLAQKDYEDAVRSALTCNSCGANRAIEDCKGSRIYCPIHGIAQNLG